MKKYVLLAVGMLWVISCKHHFIPDNFSDNIHYVDSLKIGHVKNVVILGNSIVRHGPLPSIGWVHNWGMAASSMDSDFVHLLIRDIQAKDASVQVAFKNIADWESNFNAYDYSQLDSLRNMNPDLLIMRVGENVKDSMAAKYGFTKYYDSLINYMDPRRKAVRIITDGFWQKEFVNKQIHAYAISHNYPFIEITKLRSDESNTAKGQFKNLAVAEHPSNKGMRAIENKLWNYLKKYFPESR